jgi:hypothetical protein
VIAFLLGYGEVSTFSHAFKRCPPTRLVSEDVA